MRIIITVALSKAVVGNLRPHEYRYIILYTLQRRGRYNEYRFYLEQSTRVYMYRYTYTGTRKIISPSCYAGSTIFVPLGALSRRRRKPTTAVVAHPSRTTIQHYILLYDCCCFNLLRLSLSPRARPDTIISYYCISLPPTTMLIGHRSWEIFVYIYCSAYYRAFNANKIISSAVRIIKPPVRTEMRTRNVAK